MKNVYSLGAMLLLVASVSGREAESPQDTVADHIRRRIEATDPNYGMIAQGAHLYAANALPRFYVQRIFRPAWSDGRRLFPQSNELLESLRSAEHEGLRAEDYHLEEIQHLVAAVAHRRRSRQSQDARMLADLDLLLTDAFLVYGAHLMSGRVNPETIDPEWHAARREADLTALLERSLSSGGPAKALRDLLPRHEGYGRLKRALTNYTDVAARGGWPRIPDGPAVALGEQDPRIPALTQRLALVGDVFAATDGDGNVLDSLTVAGLVRFQVRHGLEPDGVLGNATLAALNVPVEERIRQLELNLERWRWLPQDLGERHIIVNAAGFDLEVFEGMQVVLAMKVVVGRTYRRTPVFSAPLRYLVFNPFWHVPHSLAVLDQVPMQQNDSAYFSRVGMRVFEGWGSDAREIDPVAVDWTSVTPDSFSYRLRQDPGPQNALGRVKFMLPNRHNVYLHDTPSRDLFARAQRDFSSGCIRLERAMDLAEYLLRDAAGWDPHAIATAATAGVETTVPLPNPVPVHILYWTAWANEDGTIHFRQDIYRRDERLLAALLSEPPGDG